MDTQKTTLLVPGASYYLQNLETGRYLTSNSGTNVTCEKLDQVIQAVDNQTWTLDYFQQGSDTVVSFVSNRNGYRLALNGNSIPLIHATSTNDTNAGWLPRKDSADMAYAFVSYADPTKLLKENTHSGTVAAGSADSVEDNELWTLLLADLELTSTIRSIVYDPIENMPQTQRTLVDSGTIQNLNANCTVDVNVAISKGIESSFSWSLNESLTIGLSSTTTAEGNIGIPMVANGKISQAITISGSATVGSEQVWTNVQNVEYSTAMTITVPPGAVANYYAYANMVSGLRSTFRMQLKLTAKITGNNNQLTGSQLEKLLSDNKTLGGVTYTVERYSIILHLTGVFTGSYGISTYTEVA